MSTGMNIVGPLTVAVTGVHHRNVIYCLYLFVEAFDVRPLLLTHSHLTMPSTTHALVLTSSEDENIIDEVYKKWSDIT